MSNKTSVCYKCRWLVVHPDGFFKAKKNKGMCDKCSGQMTIFQQCWDKEIWLQYIPIKPKVVKEQPKTGDSVTPTGTPSPKLGSIENNEAKQ